MSYNIFSKNASFKGDVSGTIENQVNDWDNQTIAGNKTFTNPITSSASVMLSGSGKVSASFYYGDGSNLAGVGQNAAGLNRQVQFNDGGTNFGGSSNFTFTAANQLQVAGQISASLGVSGAAFHGDGANITGINAGNIAAGTLADARIPNLNASKINAGTFDTARIPDLNASKITAGTFADARIAESNVTQHQLALSIGGNQIGGTINNGVLPTTIDRPILSASTGISGAFFQGNGSGLTGVTGTPTPAGSNTQIQFNDNGSLAGDAQLTFITASNTLAVTALAVGNHISSSAYAIAGGTVIDSAGNFAGNNASFNEITASSVISSSANISGAAFFGDGRQLSGAPLDNAVQHAVVTVVNPTDKTITSAANFKYDGADVTVQSGDVKATNLSASSNLRAGGNLVIGGETILNNQGNIVNTPATAVITIANNPTAGDTISFGDSTITPVVVSTYQTRGASDDDILIGASVGTTRLNTKNKLESLHNVSVTIDGNNLLITNNNSGLIGNRTISETFTSVNNTVSGFTGGYSIDIFANEITASSFSSPNGTLISAVGDFQGNNASFNEITASSVISSSANISASAFFGDGSNLTGIGGPTTTEYHVSTQTILSEAGKKFVPLSPGNAGSSMTSKANITNVFHSTKNFVHWVAPASGSIKHITVNLTDASTIYSIPITTGGNTTVSKDNIIFMLYKNDNNTSVTATNVGEITASAADLSFSSSVGRKFLIPCDTGLFSGSREFDPGDVLKMAGFLPNANGSSAADAQIVITYELSASGV